MHETYYMRKGLSNITLVTEGEEKENGGRAIFKSIFQNCWNTKKAQIQEALTMTIKQNKYHIIFFKYLTYSLEKKKWWLTKKRGLWIKTRKTIEATTEFTNLTSHQRQHKPDNNVTISFFYWSIVALQCHVSFCCTIKWISYTYIHSFLDFLPI